MECTTLVWLWLTLQSAKHFLFAPHRIALKLTPMDFFKKPLGEIIPWELHQLWRWLPVSIITSNHHWLGVLCHLGILNCDEFISLQVQIRCLSERKLRLIASQGSHRRVASLPKHLSLCLACLKMKASTCRFILELLFLPINVLWLMCLRTGPKWVFGSWGKLWMKPWSRDFVANLRSVNCYQFA